MMQDPGMMQAMMGMMGGAGMPGAGAGASNPMGGMDPAMIGQMMQNPVMQQMMNNMFQNPAMLQQMIQSNPMLQQMSQQNPMMAQMMSNPAVLQGAMQMMQNPQMMQMLQNPQMMQALGGTPGAMRGLPAPTATPPAGDAGAPAVPPANPMAAMMQDPAMMQAVMGMMGGSPPPTATPPAEGAGVPAVPPSAGMGALAANPMAAMMQDPGMMQAMMGMMGGAGMPGAGAGATNPMGGAPLATAARCACGNFDSGRGDGLCNACRNASATQSPP